jgi:hypothetical protein
MAELIQHVMRFSDLFFGLLLFGGGVVTGVFLREADVVTGNHIKTAAKKVVNKVKNVGKDAPVENN